MSSGAVLGPNGSGKSSIVKMITGMVEPTRGAVWFQGERGLPDPVHRVRSFHARRSGGGTLDACAADAAGESGTRGKRASWKGLTFENAPVRAVQRLDL